MEHNIIELINFFKEMGIESKFEEDVLQIGYIPNKVKNDFKKVLDLAETNFMLRYNKLLKVKYL